MGLGMGHSVSPVPGFGKHSIDFGERDPDPPAHHHVGPWAVFQAFDPQRYTREDRHRAALAMRYLVMDPNAPRADLVAVGRRALATVLMARLMGERIDDVALYVRVMHAPSSQHNATVRGYR